MYEDKDIAISFYDPADGHEEYGGGFPEESRADLLMWQLATAVGRLSGASAPEEVREVLAKNEECWVSLIKCTQQIGCPLSRDLKKILAREEDWIAKCSEKYRATADLKYAKEIVSATTRVLTQLIEATKQIPCQICGR